MRFIGQLLLAAFIGIAIYFGSFILAGLIGFGLWQIGYMGRECSLQVSGCVWVCFAGWGSTIAVLKACN